MKKIKIPFEEEYIKDSVAQIDADSIFDDDEKVRRKIKAIKKELKITWIKGYKKGLIDRDNY